jgi:hypothetical protein
MRPYWGPLLAALAAAFVAFAAAAENEGAIAQLAIDALAEELQIAKEDIEVDTVRAVDWPDSSIGCPQPGRSYLQVITPGHKITLRANDRIFVVHESGQKAFVCQRTKAMGGVTPELELEFGPQLVEARKDLAERLRVPESEILVISGEQHTWNDASLGCPVPGTMYAHAEVTGWVLTLKHRAHFFTYHTDGKRTIPCPAVAAE